MSDLFHECGIVAVYHLPGLEASPLAPKDDANASSRLVPRLLLDIQNRGQLAAGMTSFNAERNRLIDTHKDVGTVNEVFHLSHRETFEQLMHQLEGPAAIGHVRYATCGQDDRSYAQPFEREHIEKRKWFGFAFNGQLANYPQLRDEIVTQRDFHLARDTDTEILMHLISQQLSKKPQADLLEILSDLSEMLDGAYNIVFLNAVGEMFVARDPLGIRPLCYAIEGSMFAAASESVALAKMGFQEKNIKSLAPGCAILIQDGKLTIEQFIAPRKPAHCFFEWIYFANVASTLDDRSVYMTRKRLGEELARLETLQLDRDTIVVPVPDTAKAAADSMAYQLNVPSLEGLIRNRYVGRTFIEGGNRAEKVLSKFMPLREVMEGKRVLLVEDSIVRSTTLRTLISQIRERGGAKEVHVRVACPPIFAPCFYGIDMSTVEELFAPKFLKSPGSTAAAEAKMAESLEADSLRYLPIESIARSIGLSEDSLCQACLDGQYPTSAGRELYQLALGKSAAANKSDPLTDSSQRTYDIPAMSATNS